MSPLNSLFSHYSIKVTLQQEKHVQPDMGQGIQERINFFGRQPLKKFK